MASSTTTTTTAKKSSAKKNTESSLQKDIDGPKNYVSSPLSKKVLEYLREAGTNASASEMTITQTQVILDAFIRVIIRDTMAGESTLISNFISFDRTLEKERVYMVPNKDAVTKPAHYKLKVGIKPAIKRLLATVPVPKS
jgi:hypothetical protein